MAADRKATAHGAVGAVERACASVRLVEANVCVGGAWLEQSAVSELAVDKRDTFRSVDSHCGCVHWCTL
jgi:hypothetical protein